MFQMPQGHNKKLVLCDLGLLEKNIFGPFFVILGVISLCVQKCRSVYAENLLRTLFLNVESEKNGLQATC
jgi:hypothetical protein